MKLASNILNRKLYTFYYDGQAANGWLNSIATHQGSTEKAPFQASGSLLAVVKRCRSISEAEYLQVCGDYLIFVDVNGNPTGKRLQEKITSIEEIR